MKKGQDYVGVGVGAMIFDDDGRLLLTKRGQGATNERGCWEVPGGSIEFGETRAEAVVREVMEELGVAVEVVEELHTIDHLIPAENEHWIATPFIVRILDAQEPKIMEPHKCDAIEWFEIDKLPSPLSITTELNLQVYARSLENVA